MSRNTGHVSSVRTRMLLLATLPVFVVSLVLSLFYIADHQEQLSAKLEQFGQSVAGGASSASVLAMFANDRDRLLEIGHTVMRTPDVEQIAFFDTEGKIMLSVGGLQDQGSPVLLADKQWLDDQYREERYWYFRTPVQEDVESIADYEEPAAESQPLGWVMVTLSQDKLRQANRRNIWLGVSVSLITALLASVVASWLSRRIYQPISNLTRTVETMESGDLSAQATVGGDREVRTLARVINRMAGNLNETNIRLSREVERATSDLRQAMVELEHRNVDLEVARDDLEKAMGAREQFLARMSHELRTPLATITGFTRRLQHTQLNSEQEEYRHAIQHSSAILLSVIDDILEFARMEHGDIALESLEFDLESELEDLVAMHAPGAYEKSIEMILLLDADVPRKCVGDPARLRQVLSNLLANAVKFTESGEIVLRVSRDDGTEVEEIAGTGTVDPFRLEVEVSDSGVGISQADAEKLFQPFSQADTSISRRFGGSGLGLVICRQLIELMGGEIAIESEPGKGTTVRFHVHLQQLQETAEQPLVPWRADAVAVIAANPLVRRALRTQLTYWSRQVYAFADIEALVAHLQSGGEGVTSLLASPEFGIAGSKEEGLALIRGHFSGPVILLTYPAHADAAALDSLIRDYAPLWTLAKPVRRKKLLALLEAILEGDAFSLGEGLDDRHRQEPSVKESQGCLQDLDILVAEDNHYNRKLIRNLLEAEGARVTLAEDGAQALEQFSNSNCSLVLMDAHMPGADGIQACVEILALAPRSGREVVIIGLTADLLESEKQRFLEAGAAEVLFKPFDERDLLAAICRHAGRADSGKYASIGDMGAASMIDLQREMQLLLQRLRRSIAEGRPEQSREIVHQMQGLTGLYGLADIRRSIDVLREGLVVEGRPALEEQLGALEAEVNALVGQTNK